MKKIAIVLLALAMMYGGARLIPDPRPAHALVSCSLPYNLQNNTVADATQVMANYNQLVSCLATAASAGVNTDITALSALSTPITVAQGGTPMFVGSSLGGTPDSITIGVTSPASFSLTLGRLISFVPLSNNTGPTQINVTSLGLVNLYRRTQVGLAPMVGGELVTGAMAVAAYDGTQFQLVTNSPVLVGQMLDWVDGTAPAGWRFTDGACVSRSTFATLFSVMGTNFGVCDGATTFGIPDGRGRAFYGRDDMGGSAANRITVAGSGCQGAGISNGCGGQNLSLGQSNLPSVNFTVSGITLSNGTISPVVSGGTIGGTTSQGVVLSAGGNSIPVGTSTISVNPLATNVSVSSQGTAASGGSGAAVTSLSPALIVNKIIKY